MTYDAPSPFSGKIKEYANEAEWLAELEKATAKPKEKPVGKMTYAQAAEKVIKEMGIELGGPKTPEEKMEELIERRITEGVAVGVAAALEQQQAAAEKQTMAPKSAPFIDRLPTIIFDPKGIDRCMEKQRQLKENHAAVSCGCSHAPKAEPIVHSMRGTGPIMSAQLISKEEVQRRFSVSR